MNGLAPRDRLELEAAERIALVLLQFRRLAALDGVLLTAATATDMASVGERRRRRDRQVLVGQLRDWLRDAASGLPGSDADQTPTGTVAATTSPPPYVDTLRLIAEADSAGRSARPHADADEPLIAVVTRQFGDLEAAASWAEHHYDELLAESADADTKAGYQAAERSLAVMERTSKLGSRLSLELDRASQARTRLLVRAINPPQPTHRPALPGDHTSSIPTHEGETKPTPPQIEGHHDAGEVGEDQG